MRLSDLGPAKTIRCAIYTRKSTEDGLDQAFNSLDAQREACAAYVTSQRHEGWTLQGDSYDDGGFSGGSMERPGLKRLMEAVKAGQVDVIVDYKVDRLTRSLADFAKIVEILDVAEASFVSVTQAFNTTTSMGRLTLNVLLSFAQFEREVTGERIRDKVAASKKKGIWMGGNIPLGYDVVDRKLVVNATDAERVQYLFDRYHALGSVPALQEELEDRKITSKRRTSRSGRMTGGTRFTHGALSHILTNRTYIGLVHHKGQYFPGEHQPIIDKPLFDAVQAIRAGNSHARKTGANIVDPSLLSGLIRDASGQTMIATHTSKGSLRYRYYISRKQEGADTPVLRVPAGEIETAIIDRIIMALEDHDLLHRLISQNPDIPIAHVRGQIEQAKRQLTSDIRSERKAALQQMVADIILTPDSLTLQLRLDALLATADDRQSSTPSPEISICIPTGIVRAGREVRLAIAPSGRPAATRHDKALIMLIAKAHSARHMALERPELSADALAQELGLSRDYGRVLIRIGFLAPDITTAILEGKQPATLTRQTLARMADLPLCWERQREVLGF